MNLYIFRHGIAVNVGQQGVTCDFDRMLSSEGQERTRLAALGLETLECKPSRILTSPLVRAVETANIAASVLGSPPVVETDELVPGEPMSKLLEKINADGDDEVMVVGHNPHLEDLVAFLVSGARGFPVILKKAACCCVSFYGAADATQGTVLWLMPPKALRKLGS